MKKFFLVAGIVILILIIAGIVFVYTNKDKIMNYAVDKAISTVEHKVVAAVPDTVMKDSVKTMFEKVANGMKDGTIAPDKFQNIFLYYQNAVKDKQLDSLEVSKIIQQVRDLYQPVQTQQ